MSESAVGELAGLLLRELDEAIRLALTHAPGVRVDRVALRIGQSGADGDQPLFLERYPEANGGWRLELDATPVAVTPTKPLAEDAPALLDFFASEPLAWLKGIDRQWSLRLRKSSITTLGQLANAGDEVLQELMEKHNSPQPILLRARVRVLRYTLPVWPATVLDEQPVSELVLKPLVHWRQQIKSTAVTTAELNALVAMAEVTANCIDIDKLRRLTIGQLRDML